MKTPQDPRHKKRQRLVQELFSMQFHTQKVSKETKEILEMKEQVDAVIEKAAPEFPVNKINNVDLAILRLALFELLFEKKEPQKVIIDEAVELAKEYGGNSSYSFINGVLGTVLSKYDEFTKV